LALHYMLKKGFNPETLPDHIARYGFSTG